MFYVTYIYRVFDITTGRRASVNRYNDYIINKESIVTELQAFLDDLFCLIIKAKSNLLLITPSDLKSLELLSGRIERRISRANDQHKALVQECQAGIDTIK